MGILADMKKDWQKVSEEIEAKTKEKEKARAAKNANKMIISYTISGAYYGTHPELKNPHRKLKIFFTNKGIFIGGNPKKLQDDRPFKYYRWKDVVGYTYEDSTESNTTQRLTATRMLAVGVFSLAAPKKSTITKGYIIHTVATKDGEYKIEQKVDYSGSLGQSTRKIDDSYRDDTRFFVAEQVAKTENMQNLGDSTVKKQPPISTVTPKTTKEVSTPKIATEQAKAAKGSTASNKPNKSKPNRVPIIVGIVVALVIFAFIGSLGGDDNYYDNDYDNDNEIVFRDTEVCMNARAITDNIDYSIVRDHVPPAGIIVELKMHGGEPTLEQIKAVVQNIICEREISKLVTVDDFRERNDNRASLHSVVFLSNRTVTLITPGMDDYEQRIRYATFISTGAAMQNDRGPAILFNDGCVIDENGIFEDESCIKTEFWSPVLPE